MTTRYLTSLILTILVHQSHAQDISTDLKNNMWVLTSAYLDGEYVEIPSPNPHSENIHLSIDERDEAYTLNTSVCNNISIEVKSLLDSTLVTGEKGSTLIVCTEESLQHFENLYFKFFGLFDDSDTVLQYWVSLDSISHSVLYLVNPSLDTLVYRDQTASNDYNEISAFRTYPNPASNFIKLDFKESSSNNLNLHIYTLFGQLLKDERITSRHQEISIREMKSGNYIIKLWIAKGRFIIPNYLLNFNIWELPNINSNHIYF